MTVSGEDLSSVARVVRSSVGSVPPSIPPPGDEHSPEVVAARVLSRQRGVVPSESSLRLAVTWVARFVARAFAFPLGAVVGTYLGIAAAPLLILTKRIALVFLS